eukprot:COSAG06_NODE_57647_length_279_cov_1.594444_1_plen_52_part_01
MPQVDNDGCTGRKRRDVGFTVWQGLDYFDVLWKMREVTWHFGSHYWPRRPCW